MPRSWADDEWRDDDIPDEPRWSEPLSFGDPDAWRGTEHAPDDGSWRAGSTAADEGWPEWDAGPEYRMWKRLADGER